MKSYVQITAGRGPEECARAVYLVAQELMKKVPVLRLVDWEAHKHRSGCYMSMTLSSEDPIENSVVKEWEGTVLWRSTSNPFRPGHKRSNWYVGVNFFNEVELTQFRESDIVFETCRSGGKGGQNVNKVETTVRAIHIPTGLAVKCSEERSQSLNKERAKERLLLKLREQNDKRVAEAVSNQWSKHDSLERGNPVKRFRGSL